MSHDTIFFHVVIAQMQGVLFKIGCWLLLEMSFFVLIFIGIFIEKTFIFSCG